MGRWLSQVRDFIYSHDVANAMIELIKIGYNKPVNLGSGKGVTIRKIVNILCKLEKNLKVTWDQSKPTGDKVRIMNVNRLKKLGIKNNFDIQEGIERTFDWYKKNYKRNFIDTILFRK